jgi:hypothetical protein
MLRILCALLIIATSTSARSDSLGATRVGVVDMPKLWATGGIARWLDARAKLDAEQATYKPAEAPAGTPPKRPPMDVEGLGLPDETKKKLQHDLDEIERKEHVADIWKAHEREVLEPIMLDVEAALGRFAKTNGVGLVLDRAKLAESLIAIAPGVDLTAAFIKDYNAAKHR